MSEVVARVVGLGFVYGGASAPALAGVDLELRAGELLLLEGPSGGGKSTLLRALCGLVPHFHGGRMWGRVVVGGLDTARARPAAVARLAALLMQEPEAQAVMGGVERDVAFGPLAAGVPAAGVPARVAAALEAVGAGHLAGRRVGELSGGERQRVALAGLLALRPRALLLDEPLSALDPVGAVALVALLRRLADHHGVAVVVAEHRGERLRAVADRVLAVVAGRLEAPAAEPPLAAAAPPAPAPTGPARAELRGVSAGFPGRPVLRAVSLALAAGTVTTLAGPNGCGKSTLLRVLAGLHAPEGGRVLLGGQDVTERARERRLPALGLVGQDPGRHLLTERVCDEVAYALARLGVPAPERAVRAGAMMDVLGLAELAQRHPRDLSVGQRERVALAAVLVADPAVLALDEPTRGMDPARKAALAALLRARAAAGAAVLVATHDAGFARAVAHRALVLDGGRLRPAPAPAAAAA